MAAPGDPVDSPAPAAHDSMDDVIALYRRDVDRSLLRANLAKTPDERFRDLVRVLAAVDEFRRAGVAARSRAAIERETDTR